MALPSNDHHVHSDGYRSDRGEPNRMRLMEEIADEIEQIDAVQAVYPDEDLTGPYVSVEHESALDAIEAVVSDVDCRVESIDGPGPSDIAEIRPA